jgi:hypothetical protein
MTTDPHPRYVLHEFTGYENGGPSGRRREQTDLYVMDTWYGWAVLATFQTAIRVAREGTAGGGLSFDERLARLRRLAAVLVAQLNAEHDAWLADG